MKTSGLKSDLICRLGMYLKENGKATQKQDASVISSTTIRPNRSGKHRGDSGLAVAASTVPVPRRIAKRRAHALNPNKAAPDHHAASSAVPVAALVGSVLLAGEVAPKRRLAKRRANALRQPIVADNHALPEKPRALDNAVLDHAVALDRPVPNHAVAFDRAIPHHAIDHALPQKAVPSNYTVPEHAGDLDLVAPSQGDVEIAVAKHPKALDAGAVHLESLLETLLLEWLFDGQKCSAICGPKTSALHVADRKSKGGILHDSLSEVGRPASLIVALARRAPPAGAAAPAVPAAVVAPAPGAAAIAAPAPDALAVVPAAPAAIAAPAPPAAIAARAPRVMVVVPPVPPAIAAPAAPTAIAAQAPPALVVAPAAPAAIAAPAHPAAIAARAPRVLVVPPFVPPAIAAQAAPAAIAAPAPLAIEPIALPRPLAFLDRPINRLVSIGINVANWAIQTRHNIFSARPWTAWAWSIGMWCWTLYTVYNKVVSAWAWLIFVGAFLNGL
eukprot:TRINITY_DN2072_c0_g1_i1.p1 TRINITY_DN2072_c0_g1~~TRINITY_DN2072_c0_g1_i1.p1  ORF type:complete len:501 (+),score=62.09 TRINITY_DN2072_c0_g1_i1:390-1892(+)